jgi:Rrf2 family protein
MQLTRESVYAIQGLAFLARQPSRGAVALADVAAAQNLPTSFLAKIFQKLARHGVLAAGRGRASGYVLTRSPDSITMREILVAVEGPGALQRCLLWSGLCDDEHPCPLHFRLGRFRPALESLLAGITLADYVTESRVSMKAAAPPRE